MPNPLFDSATLAIVAYAHVVGSDGNSTACSDKLTTTRLGAGHYQLTLPSGLFQDKDRSLILVTPQMNSTGTDGYLPVCPRVLETSSQVKEVYLSQSTSTTAVDSDFDVLVLRTTLP